jgi:hypothetical protein
VIKILNTRNIIEFHHSPHTQNEALRNEIINLVIKIMYSENGAVNSFGKLFSNLRLPEREKDRFSSSKKNTQLYSSPTTFLSVVNGLCYLSYFTSILNIKSVYKLDVR